MFFLLTQSGRDGTSCPGKADGAQLFSFSLSANP